MAAFVQSAASNNTAGTAGALTATLPSNVTAGDTLLVWYVSSDGTPAAPTGNGNTFSLVLETSQYGGVCLYCYACQNAAAGATTISVTNNVLYSVYVQEYSGLVTFGGALASVWNGQNGPGSGANVATSTAISITAPAILIGLTLDTNAITGATNPSAGPTAGTSLAYTSRTVAWPDSTSSSNCAVAEDIVISSSGSYATTFGYTSGQFDGTITMAIALGASGVAAQVPYNRNQFIPLYCQ